MTPEECYEKLGGDYSDVLHLLCSDETVKKYLRAFLRDETYSDFLKNLRDGNHDAAFRSIHGLKGICMNFGFGKLLKSAGAVTEALRGGKNELTEEMLDTLQGDYDLTTEAIREYCGSNE